MVLLYQRTSCSRLKSLQNDTNMNPNLDQQMVKKGHRKRCRISSCFLYVFWTQIESQNKPKLAPNLVPQMVCKTSSEKRPILREQELREQGWVVVISRVWAPRTLRNIGTEPQSTYLHLQISTDIVYRDCQNLKNSHQQETSKQQQT